MSIKDLITRKRQSENLPERRFEGNSLLSFQNDVNRLFDDFFRGTDLTPFDAFDGTALGRFNPRINVSETDTEMTVSAELPGMDEKDVTVEMDDNTLTIRGEKKEEREEQGKNWHRMEQSYGSFHRVIDLPAGVDSGKTKAKFAKGILTVAVPKLESSQRKRKTIQIEN